MGTVWTAMRINGKTKRTVILTAFLLLYFIPVSYAAEPQGEIRSLAISPDGKLVAVTYTKGNTALLYLVPVGTGKATRLTNATTGEESSPAFSRDGNQIAYSYAASHDAPSKIAIVKLDGSVLHSWPLSSVSDMTPVFSPDDKTVVFARSAYIGNYSPIAQPHSHAWSLYTSDLEGTKPQRLTNEDFYMASPPSISADGKNVAVVTEGIDTPRKIAIYSLEHPGNPIQTLQPHVLGEADHKNPILTFPDYMPDGKSVLFMGATNGKMGHAYDYDIYQVDIGNGTVEKLTRGNGFATNLRVSADGTIAAFLKWRLDQHHRPMESELYLLDIRTHKITPLNITGLE